MATPLAYARDSPIPCQVVKNEFISVSSPKKFWSAGRKNYMGLSGWSETWKIVYPRLIEIAFMALVSC